MSQGLTVKPQAPSTAFNNLAIYFYVCHVYTYPRKCSLIVLQKWMRSFFCRFSTRKVWVN